RQVARAPMAGDVGRGVGGGERQQVRGELGGQPTRDEPGDRDAVSGPRAEGVRGQGQLQGPAGAEERVHGRSVIPAVSGLSGAGSDRSMGNAFSEADRARTLARATIPVTN